MGKQKRHFKKWTITRRIVQFSVIALFLSPLFLVKVAGDNFFFGSLASSSFFGIPLSDPFAALQVTVATKKINLAYLGGALIIFSIYLLIRGRAFCGWVCPVNTILEFTDKIRKRFKLPNKHFNRHTKVYIALLVVILSFISSIPIFELITPINNTMRNMLFVFGIGIWLLLAIVLFELFVSKRGWCRYFCPLGGFYQSIGRAGMFAVKFDHDTCVGCNSCRSVCIADPVILEKAINREEVFVSAGDCTLCGLCVDHCNFNSIEIAKRPLNIANSKKYREEAS